MSQHTIRFTLPEEREELRIAMMAGDMHAAMADFAEYLRRRWKHGTPSDVDVSADAKYKEFEKVRDQFWKLLEEYEVKL